MSYRNRKRSRRRNIFGAMIADRMMYEFEQEEEKENEEDEL